MVLGGEREREFGGVGERVRMGKKEDRLREGELEDENVEMVRVGRRVMMGKEEDR